MGYAVLHFNKAKGSSEARMTAHIERTIEPKNADKSRTHLNRELVEFPPDVTNRTQAIQHRIKTAGIFRKITSDQVRVIRVNVSGSHKDMKRILAEGRIGEWCRDNIDYFRKEFGEKNIVSATLHLDEKTPHIHIALVPVVTGSCNTVLQYHPSNANAMLTKAEAQKHYIHSLMKERKLKKPDALLSDPAIREMYAEMEATYIGLHKSGYRQMPEEMYMQWLNLLDRELEKYINPGLKNN